MPAVRQEPTAKRASNGWIVFRNIYITDPIVLEAVKGLSSTERTKVASRMASKKWKEISSEDKERFKKVGEEEHRRKILEKEQGSDTAGGQAPVERLPRRRKNRQRPTQMPQDIPQDNQSYYRRDQGPQMSAHDSQLQTAHYAHQAPITPDEDWTPASSTSRPQGYFWQTQDGPQLEQAAPYYEVVSNEIPVSAAPDHWNNNATANTNFVPNTMNNVVSYYAASEVWPEVGAEYNATQLLTPPEPYFANNGYEGRYIYDNTVGGHDGQAHNYAGFDYFAAPTAAPVQLSREDWEKICNEEPEEEEEEEVDSDPDLLIQATETVASTLLAAQEAVAPRFEEEENLAEGEDAIADFVEDTRDLDLPVSQANSVHDQDGPLEDFGEISPPSIEVSSFEFYELDIYAPSAPYQPLDPAYFQELSYQELSYQEWSSGEAFVHRQVVGEVVGQLHKLHTDTSHED